MSGKKIIAWILCVLISAAIGFACAYFIFDKQSDERKIASLQETIKSLRILLATKDRQRDQVNDSVQQITADAADNSNNSSPLNTQSELGSNNQPAEPAPLDVIATLKDLETVSDTDPRTPYAKIKDFLSNNTGKDAAAIASHTIYDLARNRDSFPDYDLQSIYNQNNNPDIRRVVAQVLSQRGNNSLLDKQIVEAQEQLKSDQPRTRQDALVQLAQTRSIRAVDSIIPFLHDEDINVRLDALHALNVTGNQKHVAIVEAMTSDPDPAINTLANEVLINLKNLSTTARTTISRADIEATLPMLSQ